jgi:hypothetical protein
MKEKETIKLTFSNSRIKSYLSCPTIYYWTYVRNLVPAQKSSALKYGEVIHSMFNQFYVSFLESGSEEIAKKEAKEKLIFDYCANNINHTTKTVETGLIFLKEVIDFGLHLRDEVHPEEKITKEVISLNNGTENIQIFLEGRIDLRTKTNKTGYIEIFDFKTTSRLDGMYYIKNEMDRQFITYSWLADTYNCSIIPLHCTKKPSAYAPYLFMYSVEQQKVFLEETKSIIWDIISKDEDYRINPGFANNIYPRSCTNCTGTFGCDYRELCIQGSLEDAYVGDMFTFREEENGIL